MALGASRSVASPLTATRTSNAPVNERNVAPFDFFVERASAIIGLGTPDGTPDASYCFHTHYLECKPGQARYEMKLEGVTCEQGEMLVRVLAFRKGGDSVAIAGRRIDLVGLNNEDVEQSLVFVAEPNVKYAMYGFLSELVPVEADALTITLKEYGATAELRQSRLARIAAPAHVSNTSQKLFILSQTSCERPSSQPFDEHQWKVMSASQDWRAEIGEAKTAVEAWTTFVALNGARRAGMLDSSLDGLVVDIPGPLAGRIAAAGPTVDTTIADKDYDFVIGRVTGLDEGAAGGELANLLDCLADGGWGMFFIVVPPGTEAGKFRNLAQRLALGLLSGGHELYQIQVHPRFGWLPANGTAGAFVLQFKHRIASEHEKGTK